MSYHKATILGIWNPICQQLSPTQTDAVIQHHLPTSSSVDGMGERTKGE